MPLLPLFDPRYADDEGLVSVGGDLSPQRLLLAYRRGIFPWYDETTPILWWSPDPRAIIKIDGLHVSRRLARTIRSGKFTTTVNRDFAAVVAGCGGERHGGTWLVPDMIEAYQRLHELGWAHSVEAWHGDVLAGGLYGVAIGGFFSAESMFTRVRDGSKVALAALMDRVRERGFTLVDIQLLSDHTRRMGAIEVPRLGYLRLLKKAIAVETTFV